MVLVGNPRSPETSKKITTLGCCLNLQRPVVWGFWSGAAHGLCHTAVLCPQEAAGSGLEWVCWLEPLTGLLRRCSRYCLSKSGHVWAIRFDAMLSNVCQALGQVLYTVFPERI